MRGHGLPVVSVVLGGQRLLLPVKYYPPYYHKKYRMWFLDTWVVAGGKVAMVRTCWPMMPSIDTCRRTEAEHYEQLRFGARDIIKD
jgi:hypothetical protein